MSRGVLLFVLAASASVVGASPAQDCAPTSAPVRAVRAVAAGIIAADNARDIDRVLGYYAADAILMPPGEAAVAGRAAIRARYEALFADFDPRIEARVDEACAGSGLAFIRGHNGGQLAPRRGGEPRSLDDEYLMLLRLDDDGVWRISHLMWHRVSAPVRGPS